MRATIVLGAAAALLLLAAGAGSPAPAAEAAPAAPAPAPGTREVAAGLQTATPLPCLTPKECCDEFTKVTITDGKGTLALPVKGGTLNVLYARGAVALEVPGDPAGRATTAVGLPREGFAPPLVINLEYADKSTGIAALAFARSRKEGDLLVRNMAVAAAQLGDNTIFILDDNCNGKYNDVGEDAILGDRGRLAAPLGSTAVLGGSAFGLQVAENGRKFTLTAAATKLGTAGLDTRSGWGRLAGAVVKGSDGAFALRPDQQVAVPAGSYALAFAVLEDAGGRRALVRGGDLKLDVPEGGRGTLPNLGPAKLTVAAAYDPPTQRVTVEAPKADSVTCSGGTITYFFPLAVPDLSVVDPAFSPARLMHGYKMPGGGGALTFTRAEAGLVFTRKYRLEMTWPVGLGPNPTGSAEVEIALPPPPPKKN